MSETLILDQDGKPGVDLGSISPTLSVSSDRPELPDSQGDTLFLEALRYKFLSAARFRSETFRGRREITQNSGWTQDEIAFEKRRQS